MTTWQAWLNSLAISGSLPVYLASLRRIALDWLAWMLTLVGRFVLYLLLAEPGLTCARRFLQDRASSFGLVLLPLYLNMCIACLTVHLQACALVCVCQHQQQQSVIRLCFPCVSTDKRGQPPFDMASALSKPCSRLTAYLQRAVCLAGCCFNPHLLQPHYFTLNCMVTFCVE